MQIQRLFEIIYLLLNKKTVTAEELARRFEVSTRTIYRDIDALSAAGIPVFSTKGRGGGIGLMDHFVLNKSVLNAKEQQEILNALQGLSMMGEENREVLGRLSALFNQKATDWIAVDFSDWGRLKDDRFTLIKVAILERRLMTFQYDNAAGQRSLRRIEPLQLWFKHRSWYVKGFCLDRQDFRVFRLSRLRDLQILDEGFKPRSLPPSALPAMSLPEVELTLRLKPQVFYRAVDEFPEAAITHQPDGSMLVTLRYVEDEWVYGLILSFGPHAEVLAPLHIREIIKERLTAAQQYYQ